MLLPPSIPAVKVNTELTTVCISHLSNSTTSNQWLVPKTTSCFQNMSWICTYASPNSCHCSLSSPAFPSGPPWELSAHIPTPILDPGIHSHVGAIVIRSFSQVLCSLDPPQWPLLIRRMPEAPVLHPQWNPPDHHLQ